MSSKRALAAVALLAALPAPASAERVISVERKPVNLDAFGRDVVWGARDARGRHRLRHFDGERVRTAPIRPNGLAFDPDLGPGRVVAYTRCRRACVIHLLDLDTGRERPLRRLGRGRLAIPSVWGSRVVFVRIRGLQHRVFTGETDGSAVREITGAVSDRVLEESWVEDTEATESGSWFLRMAPSGDGCTDTRLGTLSELRFAERTGGPSLVDAACRGRPVQSLRGALTGDAEAVTLIGVRGPDFRGVVRSYRGGATEEAPLPADETDAVLDSAVSAGVAYFVRERRRLRTHELVRGDPLTFAPVARQVR